MTKKQMRKLMRDIERQKTKRQKTDTADTLPQQQRQPAAAEEARRGADPWLGGAEPLAPDSPKPYPHPQIQGLMWAAGDTRCGGVGTTAWMATELQGWGGSLLAEAASRRQRTAAASTAAATGQQKQLSVPDVRAVLPVACARYDRLQKNVKKARAAQQLSTKPEVELTSQQGTAAAAAAASAAGSVVSAAVDLLRGGGAVAAAKPKPREVEMEKEQQEKEKEGLAAEDRSDFIEYADQRTKTMTRAEHLAFTQSREISLARSAASFVAWLQHHQHQLGSAAGGNRSSSSSAAADRSDEEDYDFDEDESDSPAAASASTTAGEQMQTQTQTQTQVQLKVAPSARSLLAHILRERLFAIVSTANRTRDTSGTRLYEIAATGDGEAAHKGQLSELVDALTVPELAEASRRLPPPEFEGQ